jgi:hypothetical protein
MERLNIDINELAKYIFVTNQTERNEIFLDVKSLKTNKELFFFFFELFCKGLVLLFGEGSKLCLDTLTMEQLDNVRGLMRFAHIKLNVVVYDEDTAKMIDEIEVADERKIVNDSMEKLRASKSDLPISEYVFNLFINKVLYIISFDVV